MSTSVKTESVEETRALGRRLAVVWQSLHEIGDRHDRFVRVLVEPAIDPEI